MAVTIYQKSGDEVQDGLQLLRRFGGEAITTRVDEFLRWGRKNSLWPMPFGTACCAIELMATLGPRFDMSRFGSEVIRFSPRQSDLMIVSGRVVVKMLPVLQTIWRQMPDPKWAISMGACASSGGVFDTYCMIQGVDNFIPIDVYIPGCPPRPENVIDGLRTIQKLIAAGHKGAVTPEKPHIEPVSPLA